MICRRRAAQAARIIDTLCIPNCLPATVALAQLCVPFRCKDQRTEDVAPTDISGLPELLRVALHTQNESAIGPFHGLDHAIGGIPDDPQARRYILECLMVQRVHLKLALPQEFGQPRVFGQR